LLWWIGVAAVVLDVYFAGMRALALTCSSLAVVALSVSGCAAIPAIIPAVGGIAVSAAGDVEQAKREVAEMDKPKKDRPRRGGPRTRTPKEEALRLCYAKQNAAQATHVDGRRHWIECGPNGEVQEFVEIEGRAVALNEAED
jgi:hypothetical protein